MALLTALLHVDLPRDGALRAAAQLANAMAADGLNCALTAGGAIQATSTVSVKSVSTITYLIAGAFKSKAATDPLWTPGSGTSATTVAVSSFQKYALALNAAGTASVQEAVQSKVSAAAVVWTNVSAFSPWSAFLNLTNSGLAIVATLQIATDATHTFIPGTTALNAAGITATIFDGVDQSLIPLIANETGVLVGNGV
jgi:hypothetical protein